MKVIVKVYPAKKRKVTVIWEDGRITTDEPLVINRLVLMIYCDEAWAMGPIIHHAINAYTRPESFVLMMSKILDPRTIERSGDEIPTPKRSEEFFNLFIQ